jgi:hypothetical protein
MTQWLVPVQNPLPPSGLRREIRAEVRLGSLQKPSHPLEEWFATPGLRRRVSQALEAHFCSRYQLPETAPQ